MPTDDSTEMQNAVFDDGENDSLCSPSNGQQLLPLALTKSSKSPMEALNSRFSTKQSTAVDATSVKTEESEGSTSSTSPPLTCNSPSVGADDPLRLGAVADGSPVNSVEETHADLSTTSPLKTPLATSHSVVVNGDTEADDIPLSLCVSKPGVENDMPYKGVNKDESCSPDKPTTNPESDPKPPAANPLPALIPPTSPEAVPEAEKACGSVPQEAKEREAVQSKGKSEATTPREPLPVSDAEPEKNTPMEEGHGMAEKPSVDPEPSVPAPALQTQPPRPDKPYSCSQCGKAYASRSGLKVSYEEIVDLNWC